MKLKIIIDKKTNFWFGLVGLTNFDHLGKKEKVEYYEGKVGGFNFIQKIFLKFFAFYLKRKKDKYHFLWLNYLGYNQNNLIEKIILTLARILFGKKFQKIGNEEKLKMIKGKEKIFLDKKDINFLNLIKEFVYTIQNKNDEYEVYLVMGYSENSLAGNVHSRFPGKVIISISNLEEKLLNKVKSVLVHEIIHSYFNNSRFNILKMIFEEAKKSGLNKEFLRKKIKIYFEETIIHALANNDFGLYYNLTGKKNYDFPEGRLKNFSYKKSGNNYSYLILSAAYRLIPITEKYLKNKRKIDDKYIQELIDVGNEILKT